MFKWWIFPKTCPYCNRLGDIWVDNEKRVKCEKNRTKIIYYSDLKIKYPYKVITDKNKLLKIINNE